MDFYTALLLIPIIFMLAVIIGFDSFSYKTKLTILLVCETVLVADLFITGFTFIKLMLVTLPFLVGLFRISKSQQAKPSSH